MTALSGAPVALYLRVSSEEQAQAGTLDNQRDFLTRYTELHGLAVYDIYADGGVSGVIPLHQRPEGARLLQDARRGRFGQVVVYRLDRLSRSLKVLLEAHEALLACGVSLRSATEPFDTAQPIGRFLMHLLASMAELERETIRERADLGRARAAREGRWLGGAPPFGYRVEGDRHNRRLVIHEDEAAIVRRIFALALDMGLVQLQNTLNAEGVPAPYALRGKQANGWQIGTLYRILTNTAYIGRYQHKRGRRQALQEYACPPIVSAEVFERVQALLKERFKESCRSAKRVYLLRGLIRCWCGKTLVGGMGHVYYCPGDAYRHRKGHARVRAAELEGVVWADIVDFCHHPGRVLAAVQQRLVEMSGDAAEDVRQQEAIERALWRLDEEAGRLVHLARKPGVQAYVERELERLEGERQALLARQEQVFARMQARVERGTHLMSVERLLEELRARVDALQTAEARRPLVKALVEGIRCEPEDRVVVTYCFGSRDVFDLRIYHHS